MGGPRGVTPAPQPPGSPPAPVFWDGAAWRPVRGHASFLSRTLVAETPGSRRAAVRMGSVQGKLRLHLGRAEALHASPPAWPGSRGPSGAV